MGSATSCVSWNTFMIIQHWTSEFRKQYGTKWPTDYTAFDTETTGFNRAKDLIVEWGHCIVRDGKVTDRLNIPINWFGSDAVPDEWIEQRLLEVARKVKIHTGRTSHITERYLRKRGVPVDEALPFIHEFLTTIIANGEMLVSHNGWNYDVMLLEHHFRDFLEEEFVVPDNQMIDTGAVEKASQQLDDSNAYPKPGESMKLYFKRIAARPSKVKWNLDTWCVGKYKLVEKYGVDPDMAHQAGHDAWLLHLLMEEFRSFLDMYVEPPVPKIQSAKRKKDPNVFKTKESKRAATEQGLSPTAKKRRRGQRNS